MTDWVRVEVSYDGGETYCDETLKSSSVIVQELRLSGVFIFRGVVYRWNEKIEHFDRMGASQ